MTAKELLNLIEKGESGKVEFKQRFSSFEKIAKEFIAFANTKGGVVIFGIDDDGSVYGVESEKGEANLVKETAEKYCEPPIKIGIEFIEMFGKEIVVVKVYESENKPHRVQDYQTKLDLNTAEIYIRVNDKSLPASKEMIKIMQVSTTNKKLVKYAIGKDEKIVFDYLTDHEIISVKELGELANISNRRASRTLIKLVRVNLLLIHTKDNGESFFTTL